MRYWIRFIFILNISGPLAAAGGPSVPQKTLCRSMLDKINTGKDKTKQWLWDAFNPGQVAPWLLLKDAADKKIEFEQIQHDFKSMAGSAEKVRFAVQHGRTVGARYYYLTRRTAHSDFQVYESIFLRQQLLMYCFYLIDIEFKSAINDLSFELSPVDREDVQNVGVDYCAEPGFWFASDPQ